MTIDRIADLEESPIQSSKKKSKSPKKKPPKSPVRGGFNNVSNIINPGSKINRKQITLERGLRSLIYPFDRDDKKYDHNFCHFLEAAGYRDYANLVNNHLRAGCKNNLQFFEFKNIITNIQI